MKKLGFDPNKKNNKKINIKCPLKFGYPEIEQECIGNLCAWFMPIQKACAVNVNSRSYGYIKHQQ